MNLNHDVINNIILYCPIHVIRRFLQTCKSITLDNHFWITKFQHDKIPLLYYEYNHKYPVYWINEYTKCYKINHEYHILLNKINIRSEWCKSINVKLSIDDDMSWLDKNFNRDVQKHYIKYHMFLEDDPNDNDVILTIDENKISYDVYNQDCICISVYLTITDYKKYLIKIMYYLFGYKFKVN